MRCPYCGEENLNSSVNCEVCGRPLPEPVRRAEPAQTNPAPRPRPNPQSRPAGRPAQQRPGPRQNGRNGAPVRRKKKKTRWNPKFLAACAAILAALIFIPILIAIVVHHNDAIESRRIQMFYSGNSGKTNVVLNGKVYEKTISGKVVKNTSSRDGMVQAALTENGELIYINSQKLESVATGVLDYVLSADGKKLAYVMENLPDASDTSESTTEEKTTAPAKNSKKTEEETTETTTEYVPAGAQAFLDQMDTTLFLYKGADGTSTVVANNVSAQSVSLSPSGDSLGYTVSTDEGAGFEGFCFREGSSASIGRNALPIAISDDGLRLYYVKYDRMDDVWVQKLFAKNGDDEIKLDEFADGNLLNVYLNLDYSEIVFSVTGKNGAFFYCGADSEKTKLSKGFSPIYAFDQHEVKSGKAVLTPYETFAKTVFCNASQTAQYIDGKYVCIDLGASGKSFRITPDGKTLYYLDENEYLNSCTVRKINKKEISSHVLTFELSADGDILYYVNSDNELHCVKGSKDTIAAEDVYVSTKVKLAVTDGGYLYFLQDYAYNSGTLCYLKGDGAVHVLSDINNVHDIAADVGEYIYYRSDYGSITGTFDLYYGKGKKYTRLFEKMGYMPKQEANS